MLVSRSSIVLVVLALAAGAVHAVQPTPVAAAPVPARVVVATANVYEGALRTAPQDLADSRDVHRFVQRLTALSPEAPDVVALQEVRGSLGRVVRRLNQAVRGPATYAAVSRPGLARERGRCAGHAGRFTVVRDGALVVNTATTTVLERGALRTWSRWRHDQRGVVGRGDAAGCAEHPWVRVQVTHEGVSRRAVVVGTHLGPLGHHLKTRAAAVLADGARAVGADDDLLVLAGDFNLPWCAQGARATETAHCRPAAGHQVMLDRGFGDALRASGASLGSRGRVDFLHTDGAVLAADWDRCYRASRTPDCRRRDSAFVTERAFTACHRRAGLHGRPGGACGRGEYARYYSDHPVVTATLR